MNLLGTIYEDGPELLQQVKALIAAGEDVSYETEYCESPLRVASNNGRFDVVKVLLEAGADATQLKWSPSFYEVAFGDLASIRSSIDRHADLEARDFWDRTPWLLSILVGDTDKAALLLELGADRKAVGRCGKTAMAYAVQHDDAAMLSWLIGQGFDVEARDEFLDTPLTSAAEAGATACVRLLLAAGADIYASNNIPWRAIEVASNMEIVRLLVEAGDELSDINEEMHAELIGAELEGELSVPKSDYFHGRHQRFGTSNPQKVIEPFWLDMIKTGANAYQARSKYNDGYGKGARPVWCYDRFGRSITLLADGRVIEIGGEHEDSYDPDFCIYNDVTVFHPGGEIDTYIYPLDAFQTTDFHSATLVDDFIYIIGCLGYPEQRIYGFTPVFRLDINTYGIEAVSTSGEQPGWIYEHKARLDDGHILLEGGKILEGMESERDNKAVYSLDLGSLEWTETGQ